MPGSVGLAIWVVPVVIFAWVTIHGVRRGARRASKRRAVRAEREVYRTPVAPYWGPNTFANGMDLVVREHSFEISYPVPFVFLGWVNREWYSWGTDAEMKMKFGVTAFLPPRRTRDVIALTIRSVPDVDGSEETVFLSSWLHQLGKAWQALESCGVTAEGPPPPPGV